MGQEGYKEIASQGLAMTSRVLPQMVDDTDGIRQAAETLRRREREELHPRTAQIAQMGSSRLVRVIVALRAMTGKGSSVMAVGG